MAGKNFADALIILSEPGGAIGRTFTMTGKGQVRVDEEPVVVFGAKEEPRELHREVQSRRLEQLVTCLIVRLDQAGFFSTKSYTYQPAGNGKFVEEIELDTVQVSFGGKSINSIEGYAITWARQLVVAAGLR